MSVQLILYPQYNNGYTFTSNPVLTQYVANGHFNIGLATTLGTSNNKPSDKAVKTNLPSSIWKGFRSTGGAFASCTAPSVTSAGITLSSNASSQSSTGIYQEILNLVDGQCYEIKIEITTGNSAGQLHIGNTFSQSWAVSTPSFQLFENAGSDLEFPVNVGTFTSTFTATNIRQVLLLDYRASNGQSIVISNISITECPSSAPQVFTDLADGQVICDLYEEEAIPLSLSVDDFKNVAEKVQSYSKDFHLPNTKRNNKIFGHIFEISRSDDGIVFNPYKKTRAVLKEDSYTLFEGFLQLIDINDKEGEVSYNVNLFSEQVTLADILKEKTFNDLVFDELDHQYTKTNIENSWAGNLALDNTLPSGSYAGTGTTTGVLKYPLCDWTSNKHIDASGVVQFDNLQDAFRPFIKVKYLIDRIISEAGFDYTSNFLSTTDFSKIYMDFNHGADVDITTSDAHLSFRDTNGSLLTGGTFSALFPTTTNVVIGGFTVPAGNFQTFNTTNNRFEEDTDGTINDVTYEIKIENTSGSTQNVQLRWLKTSGSTTTAIDFQNVTIAANSTYTYQGNYSINLDNNDTLQAQCNPTNSSVIREATGATILTAWANNIRTSTGITFNNKIKNLRGELNQYEFFKGIMTMFNLVVIKENEQLRIEPYSDIFLTNTDSTQHNWTDKVDVSEINLKPLELIKKTKFTYEEDDGDYSLGVYKKAVNGFLYGTKEFDATNYNLLQGEEEIVATPFAPTIIKPIFDGYDNDFIIPVIYSGNEDGTEFEGFENAPRIMYDIQTVNLPVGKYSAPLINPVFNGKQEYRQFGHISTLPTTTTTNDLNFGECQTMGFTNTSYLNLYNKYWSAYYDELYHADTRVMTMKVNLTPADIENFKFYDTVVIKNREYRVNKIEYKPNTLAKVEFILIP